MHCTCTHEESARWLPRILAFIQALAHVKHAKLASSGSPTIHIGIRTALGIKERLCQAREKLTGVQVARSTQEERARSLPLPCLDNYSSQHCMQT